MNCNVYSLQSAVKTMKKEIGGHFFKVIEYKDYEAVFGFKVTIEEVSYLAVITRLDCFLIRL